MDKRYNSSITDLMSVLQKSGLPLGQFPLEQTGTYQREQIAGAVYGGDTRMEAAKSKYMDSINRLAQLDGKLSGYYSDPGSKVYLENAADRERAISGAFSAQSQEPNKYAQEMNDIKSELENKISEAMTLFNQLDQKVPAGDGADGGLLPGLSTDAFSALFGDMSNLSVDEMMTNLLSGNTRQPLSSFEDTRPPLASFDNQDFSFTVDDRNKERVNANPYIKF